ncbi:MAG: 4Fe-4S dicluster domain-containing protein [Coriobacteriales bacterium]|nr:4Fe-4S dicluster domain-containing protein [Coriobacteriales bacterium]
MKTEERLNEEYTGTEEQPSKRGILSRRSFCIGLGGTAVLIGFGGFKFITVDPIIRPPGGQNEGKVIASCIHCEKCYEICPRNIIAPGHIEDGVLNIRTPTFNFKYDYCDWCEKENDGVPLCATICPTDALYLPAGAGIFSAALGKAELNPDWCLAYKMMGCASCYRACPYEAMELDEYGRPYVLEDVCIGCGACQAACISLSSGSISEGANERAIIVRALDDKGQIIYKHGYRGR